MKGNNNKKNQRKEDRTCEYCKAIGHLKESCFKLHGYPYWYKRLKKDKAATKGYANIVSNINSYDAEGGTYERKEALTTKCMAEIIQQEVTKILISKQPAGIEQVNFAQLDDFAGNTFKSASQNDEFPKWIIDTGATNHICAVRNLFIALKPLDKKFLIHLPDRNTKTVQYFGNIQLHKTLSLKGVLYIPSFKHNLLINGLKLTISPTSCTSQDLKTNKTIAVGREVNQLYYLDRNSFCSSDAYTSCNLVSDQRSSFHSNDEFSVWHNMLGHASVSVLEHLPFFMNKSKPSIETCEIFHFSKQTKLPFPISTRRSSKIFQLVHVDVWGLYKIQSMTGALFFF